MTSIHIQYEPNKGVNFIHLVNYLVSQKIMTIDQAISLYKRFKLAEDIVLDVPDGLVHELINELNSLGCTCD